MEQIKSFTVIFCICALCGSALSLLISSKRLKSTLRTAVLVVLASMTAAFASSAYIELPDFELADVDADFSEELDEYVESAAREVFSERIDAVLAAVCDYEYGFELDCSLEDRTITLNRAYVYITAGDAEKTYLIKSKIYSELSIETEVHINE